MAGAGIKLFNSGDTLLASEVNTYLMDQTIMKFASTSARDAAFGGAGEPTLAEGMFAYTTDTNTLWFYTGSAWQNVLGSNIGEISTSNRNSIINGAMSVWQRGTSIAVPSSANTYTTDRFYVYRGATGSTVSRQATGDTTNLPNIQYCARVQRDSGNTSTQSITIYQALETVNSIPFAGKSVTLSFYARKGANFSDALSAISANVAYGTGTDQSVGGYTGFTNIISQNTVLTTTWQRFSYTGTVAATATEVGIYFSTTPVGTAGAADYFEITGVQLEAGAVATPFEFEDYGVTLAKCQRYFQIPASGSTASPVQKDVVGIGFYMTATVGQVTTFYPVEMRTQPTATITNGTNYWNFWALNAFDLCNTVTASNLETNAASFEFTGNLAGTAGAAGQFIGDNPSAKIQLSAEL